MTDQINITSPRQPGNTPPKVRINPSTPQKSEDKPPASTPQDKVKPQGLDNFTQNQESQKPYSGLIEFIKNNPEAIQTIKNAAKKDPPPKEDKPQPLPYLSNKPEKPTPIPLAPNENPIPENL